MLKEQSAEGSAETRLQTKKRPELLRALRLGSRRAEHTSLGYRAVLKALSRPFGPKKKPSISRGLFYGAGEEGRTPDLMLGKLRKRGQKR